MLSVSIRVGAAAPRAAAATRLAPLRARAPSRAVAAGPVVAASSATAAPLLRGRPAAPTSRPSPRRSTAVHYREHRDVGRERAICDLGDSLAAAIMNLLTRPANAPLAKQDVDTLRGNTRADLPSRIDGVLEGETLTGQDQLLAWIERERGTQGSSMPSGECTGWSIIASASCPLDDAYFSLIETKHAPRTPGAAPLVLHRIIWFDIAMDDTEREVSGVHMRAQLEPEDLSALVSVDSAHRALSATPFPHDRVKPYPPGLNVDIPLGNQRRWCEARCSRNDEKVKLYGGGQGDEAAPAIDKDQYLLHDAFGVLPVLCDPTKRAMPDACVVSGEAVADIIAAAKLRFTIDCRLQDAAVSPKVTVGFTRWISMCEVKDTGEKFKLEGLEAVVFDQEGKLLDTWLFRDPTPAERKRLLGD